MRKIIYWSIVWSILIYACSSGGYKVAESYSYAVGEVIEDADYLDDKVFVTEQEASFDENFMEEDLESVVASKNTDEFLLQKKKIIKDGDITIQVHDIVTSKDGIDNLVKSVNAYYERENLKKTDYKISYDLKIRVPAGNFEKLVSSVEQGKDEVKSKNIRTRDVTEEFLDISTRLASKRDYLKQYTVLLAKATTIKDILEIKENIRKLQEEIESAEGRLRYLNDQVTFSTLTVELYQKIDYVYKPVAKDSFIERVKSGLNTGWSIIVETVLFLVNIWSVLLILTPVFFFIWRKIKKRKGENRNS